MVVNSEQDRLYAETQSGIADFVFDERVAVVFPDMIQRSVPGYNTIINMIGALAGQRVTTHSRCYDLGCSLAASALAVRQGVGKRDCRIIAVDNSPAMLQRAQRYIDQSPGSATIDLVCADIQDVRVLDASMVILNFTLQFIPVAQRQALLQSIHDGMFEQGILVLSEKITLPTREGEALFVDMHHAFKKAQGYSELEISQKRTALDNVLLPETLDAHKQRLRQVGFNTVEVWFQCFNFVSLLAIK